VLVALTTKYPKSTFISNQSIKLLSDATIRKCIKDGGSCRIIYMYL